MTCPYLKEVSMVFCRAYAVKKPVPIDRVTTASTCEGDGFKACPLFRDALVRAGRSARGREGKLEPRSTERSDVMMFAFVLAMAGVAVIGTLNLIAARA